jgi:trans-aconitate 2-methyltransferase
MRPVTDWNPESYARFAALRLRPASDLLAQVPQDLPAGPVIDLGCGNGAAGRLLRNRFPGRRLEGLDTSAAMLAVATATGSYDLLHNAPIEDWQPDDAPALIFSNAVLQWLGDHAGLLPRLARHLAPGGVLAVQMPGQHEAPSHVLARTLAREVAPDRWNAAHDRAAVADPETYWRLLSGLGSVTAWETTYIQHLPPAVDRHPVRAFTESTVLRPILDRLGKAQDAGFLASYDAALDVAYPRLPDGSAVFPFRRVFFLLRV